MSPPGYGSCTFTSIKLYRIPRHRAHYIGVLATRSSPSSIRLELSSLATGLPYPGTSFFSSPKPYHSTIRHHGGARRSHRVIKEGRGYHSHPLWRVELISWREVGRQSWGNCFRDIQSRCKQFGAASYEQSSDPNERHWRYHRWSAVHRNGWCAGEGGSRQFVSGIFRPHLVSRHYGDLLS